MKLQDLRPGWHTDFIAHRYSAHVIERADCLVVRTPANPTYYWGNCLVLPEPPRDDELARWLARFDEEITSVQPASRHVAIGVDAAPEGHDYPGWTSAGFQRIVTTMLKLERGGLRVPPRGPRGRIEFRALDLARDRDALLEVEMTDAGEFEPDGYRDYLIRRHETGHAMQRDALLSWFGLSCDGVLAATCGLMREQALQGTSARFQRVVTHTDFRRRGLCSELVHAVSEFAFTRWQVGEVYMGADPDDVAIGIYRSLGYRDIGSGFGLQKNSPQDRRP